MNKAMEMERGRRLIILNEVMEKENLDALVFTSIAQQGNQMACKWLSNYPLITRRDFGFMAKGGMPYLCVPTVGQQYNAGAISWLPRENILAGDILTPVLKFVKGLKASKPRVGLYESKDIPYPIYCKLLETGAEFMDITDLLTELRAPKSKYELDLIRKTAKLSIESFEWVVRNLEPGKTEWEIIGGAEGYLRSRGAEELLMLTRSTVPHTFITKATGTRIAADGTFVYSCEMAGPGGYWAQLVRPIFMKKGCQPEAYRVLQVIKEALKAAEEKLKPGNRICDLDAVIAAVVAKNGCEPGVWSGHGMGADLGDGISIGAPIKMEIKPNMILTLHPSVVGNGDGLLCGDTYRITDDGFENLTGAYMDTCYLDELKDEVGK